MDNCTLQTPDSTLSICHQATFISEPMQAAPGVHKRSSVQVISLNSTVRKGAGLSNMAGPLACQLSSLRAAKGT